jgi:hypothetical protein
MAPTTRLEREAEDLAKEYHNASIATRSMMQAQARLTQILSKHANVAVASIASMVQDIANAKTNTALKQQELASLRAQQVVNQRKHQADLRALQVAAADYEQNKTRRNQLNALGARRTAAEDAELARRRVDNQTLKNAASASADKERESRSTMDTLNNQMGIKTSELRNIKFTAVATAANSLADGMQKLVSTINKTQEQFGLAAGQAANLKVDNIVSSFNSYVESAKSLFSGKPEFGVSAEMIERAQAAYQNEFGGILTTDAAKDLAMQARTMGVTAEQLTKARRVFTTQSLGNVAEAKKSQDKFIAEFAKKGLTSKDAMQTISQYSELLARNGTRFATSFARAAADAKKIGIDLNKVSQFGDSLINNFEGFLEGTATLGAMGFNLDSNRLAQISETGSDADLYNELKSQLASTGKDITKLRRSERLELESVFGMTISDMQKMAGETPDGDTKSPEELQAEANGFLSKIAVGMDLMTRLLGVIANVALAAIAINTFATALGVGGIAASIVGALLPIAAGIAIIAGIAQLWKLGSALEQKGQDEIKKGNYTTGVIDKTGAGMINPATLFGLGLTGLGAAASLTGIGAAAGVPMMSAGMTIATGGALGGAALGAREGISAVNKVKKGDDVISQPGYGKRSLVTPSGVIALNNKDNIIAYADDLDGTKKLPYGSIAKKAGEKASTYGPLLQSLFQKGTEVGAPTGGISALKHLMGVSTEKMGGQSMGLAKLAYTPRNISTLFGNVGKFSPKLLKFVAQNAKAIPVLGSLIGGGFSGYDEYKKSGSLGRGIGKGLFSAAGGTLGSIAAAGLTVGNPIAASAGGIAGSVGGEMAFDAMMGPVTKADDFINGKKLPLGSISKLASKYGAKDKAKQFAESKAVTKAQELNAGGKEGLFAMAQNKFGSMFGGKTGGAMSSVSNLFTGGGSTSSNLMSMATKIPVLGGLLGKATGLLSSGGLKGMAGSLLGKVGLGSLGGSLLGGPMGLAGSLAAPLLKKIPFIGGAAAALAGGPGKLMSSALGKIGGLFGKKKAPAVSAMGAMMPEMGNMMSMLPFLSGAQPTAAQGTPQPQAPISVDTTGIEKQLNNFINALSNIQVNMDGSKVGKLLVSSNEAAASLGVFRAQSR